MELTLLLEDISEIFRSKICLMEFIVNPKCNDHKSLRIFDNLFKNNSALKFCNNCSRQTLFQKKPHDNVSCRSRVHAAASPFIIFSFFIFDTTCGSIFVDFVSFKWKIACYDTWLHSHTHSYQHTHSLWINTCGENALSLFLIVDCRCAAYEFIFL